MSVAIGCETAAQFDKDMYDAEFDVSTLVPEFDRKDAVGPVESDCLWTCWLSCGNTPLPGE